MPVSSTVDTFNHIRQIGQLEEMEKRFDKLNDDIKEAVSASFQMALNNSITTMASMFNANMIKMKEEITAEMKAEIANVEQRIAQIDKTHYSKLSEIRPELNKRSTPSTLTVSC